MSAAEQIVSAPYVEIGDSRDRAEWLRVRASGVGASDAAVIVGESRRKSAAMLFAEKRAGLEPDHEPEDGDASEWLEWGLRHEPTILAAYSSERYAGRPARSAGLLLRSTIYPWAVATLDAWTVHPVHGEIPLELKTAEVWKADDWIDGPPRDYFWQLQHQMLVTGATCASIACLLGVHRLVWCDVERDERAIRRLARAGADFWSCVENDEPPEGPLDRASLLVLFPEDDGSIVELDGRFFDLDAERVSLLERKREAEKRLAEIDDDLRGAIGRATRGVLPGGRISYSLKHQTRAEHVVKASSTRVLRRHAAKEG